MLPVLGMGILPVAGMGMLPVVGMRVLPPVGMGMLPVVRRQALRHWRKKILFPQVYNNQDSPHLCWTQIALYYICPLSPKLQFYFKKGS